jgi:hypothetical protein
MTKVINIPTAMPVQLIRELLETFRPPPLELSPSPSRGVVR